MGEASIVFLICISVVFLAAILTFHFSRTGRFWSNGQSRMAIRFCLANIVCCDGGHSGGENLKAKRSIT